MCCHLPADTLYGDGDGNKSCSDFFCLRIAYLYISEPEVSYCHIFLLAVKIILLLRSRVENFKLLTLSFEVESSRGAFKLTWQDIDSVVPFTFHLYI